MGDAENPDDSNGFGGVLYEYHIGIHEVTNVQYVSFLNAVVIASDNEWVKAAYYSGSPTGADGDGYWLYPTQSDSITMAHANYGRSNSGLIAVGSHLRPSLLI